MLGKLFFPPSGVAQIKMNVCDGFCCLTFYRIDFIVDFAGISIVVADIGPQFFFVATGYIVSISSRYLHSICFVLKSRIGIQSEQRLRFSKCLECVGCFAK